MREKKVNQPLRVQVFQNTHSLHTGNTCRCWFHQTLPQLSAFCSYMCTVCMDANTQTHTYTHRRKGSLCWAQSPQLPPVPLSSPHQPSLELTVSVKLFLLFCHLCSLSRIRLFPLFCSLQHSQAAEWVNNLMIFQPSYVFISLIPNFYLDRRKYLDSWNKYLTLHHSKNWITYSNEVPSLTQNSVESVAILI